MPFTCLRYHIVFATEHRNPFITPEVELKLYPYIRRCVPELGGRVVALNGMPDHVHLVCALRPSVSLSHFIGHLKARSNRRVLAMFGPGLNWQSSYSAFTVSVHQMDRLLLYVQGQKAHHEAGLIFPHLEWTPTHEEHEAPFDPNAIEF